MYCKTKNVLISRQKGKLCRFHAEFFFKTYYLCVRDIFPLFLTLSNKNQGDDDIFPNMKLMKISEKNKSLF